MNELAEPTRFEPVWQAIRKHLEDAKRVVSAARRSYPQPIAGCDVQFNHLSEQRDRIAEEIRRLDAARLDSAGRDEEPAAVRNFIAASPCIDDAAKRRFQDLVETGKGDGSL